MEQDNELKSKGNSINYEKRFYDPRVGRFLSIDPLEKKFPWYTPFQFAGNTPIQAIDLDGAEEYHYTLTIVNGKTHFTLTHVKRYNHVVLFWGLIDRYYKIPVKKYKVTYNNTDYYIGFAGSYGRGNENKVELFQDFVADQSEHTLAFFKDQFLSEDQSNYTETVKTVIDIQNNTVMYGPITKEAWYTPNKRTVGSGPTEGVLEVSPRVKSVAQFRNYAPKVATEFVFDPTTNTFVVGKVQMSTKGLSPHQNLVKTINGDPKQVVGGMFKRGSNGEIITNEMSGHYHQNWTPQIREQFKKFLQSKTGQTVRHNASTTF
ncbi:hypothetical protein HUK80_17585 [Flavobacterium sp. MAH-1]|uniref:Bacterial toxin 43 domain-containing protein n=2 Tax=Flavobacterium agri TaxID=2743471 RepID=A0A7Y8Y5F7_9FLAO|nr:hypothetical protein [Flavobacterium agri]NYA72742.1 hypothetical protein [Flavobacterium agri]